MPDPESKTPESTPVDRLLSLGGIAMGVVYYLVPKTPMVIILSLMFIFALLIHPIWNFRWVKDNRWRRLGASGLLVACLFLLGRASWPTHTASIPLPKDEKQTSKTQQAAPPQEKPEPPRQAKPQPKKTQLEEPRTFAPPPTPLPKGPRLGVGPDAYKDLDDVQVGQWAVEEADKISGMAEECINKSIADRRGKLSGNAPRWFFTNDFKKCCMQDVIDLRTEILRRLGPPGKDPKEESYFSYMRSENQGMLDPMMVKMYAPYLKLLGMKLKRRSVPRSAPTALHFTEKQIEPEKEGFPYRILITIETKREIKSGYIVVLFTGQPILGGYGFENSKPVLSPTDILDNEPLSKFLSENPYPNSFALQIGETPFSPNKPVLVVAYDRAQFHVSKVILYDL